MSTIYVNGEPARSAQQIANAVAFAPESVRFKVGDDETLSPLTPNSQISFTTQDGLLGMIRVNADGTGVVETSAGPQVIETLQ